MKKKFIKPDTQVISLDTKGCILAGSDPNNEKGNGIQLVGKQSHITDDSDDELEY